MEPMTSTERIFFRLERDGFPIDIVGITVLESGVMGPVPFDAVRSRMVRMAEEVWFLSRRVSRAPLGIGEDQVRHDRPLARCLPDQALPDQPL